MPEPVTIAFRSAYITLPDAEGKPLGTDAALFLSQLEWRAEHRADASGWVDWKTSDCFEETGISADKQERLCNRLEKAGYITRERRGENGVRTFQYHTAKCGNRIPQNAGTEALREGIPQNADTAKCGNRIPQNAGTEDTPLSTKDTKTLIQREYPPISPQKGEPRKARPVFLPPTSEELLAYMTEIGIPHLAGQWMAHYQANGWKVGKNPMRDWKAACRTWRETERNKNRGSPVSPVRSNGHRREDMSLWDTAEMIGRQLEEM